LSVLVVVAIIKTFSWAGELTGRRQTTNARQLNAIINFLIFLSFLG
jgi:hypothetical protein